MAGIISKLRSFASPSPKPIFLEGNPIGTLFQVDKNFYTTAGPGLVWKVHEARRKSDNKECSVFILEKSMIDKMTKPTKQKGDKDTMTDCIKNSIAMLESFNYPKFLQIVHPLEEGVTTLAFASELIIASLHDILTWQVQASQNPTINVERLICHVKNKWEAVTQSIYQDPEAPTHSANQPVFMNPPTSPEATAYSAAPLVGEDRPDEPPKIDKYWFEEMEIHYGILEICDALNYLHYEAGVVHRNVSPHVILVNSRGTWKLFGLDFIEPIVNIKENFMISVPPYSIKVSKIAQPHLDYMAPEAQINSRCNSQSDMFSLGLIICALFNQGKPLIQAECNPMIYLKQYRNLHMQLANLMPRIPKVLREAVCRLLSRDPQQRPTPLLLPLTKYFHCEFPRSTNVGAVHSLQFLDALSTKSFQQRCYFFKVSLMDSLPLIPQKLIWMHVWPVLESEMNKPDVLPSLLIPIMWLVQVSTPAEFQEYLLPALKTLYFRNLMTTPQCMLASVVFLENLHLLMIRCKENESRSELLPQLVTALDVSSCHVKQTAALLALNNCADYVDNAMLESCVLEKVRLILERNPCDLKVINLILSFYEKVLTRLEQNHVLEHVIPTMLIMRICDPETINRVVNLVKVLVTVERYGLTTTEMAKDLLPALAPFTVNAGLTIEQYHTLIETLYDLLHKIDVRQRELIESGVPRIPRIESPWRSHRLSADLLTGEAPVFSIPNLRVERDRKASSAEDMARKASTSGPTIQPTPSQSSVGTGIKKIGQWFFGSNNSTNSNNNDNSFLRVATNMLPTRRLSDNTLLNPRHAAAGPSSSSTPGGSPGSAGLPSRRHSSIGSQERRLSHVNLSPPTVAHLNRGRGGSGTSLTVPAPHLAGGSMPNASTSAPYLGASNSSVASRRDSRRPSACPSTASHLSHISRASHASQRSQASPASGSSAGLLQQIQTGVVRKLPSVPPRRIRPPPPPTMFRPAPPSSTTAAWFSGVLRTGNNALQATLRKCNLTDMMR